MRTGCPELRAQRLGVRDCVSSSLNTQPLQPVPTAVSVVRLVGVAEYLNSRTHSPGHPVKDT